MDERTGSPAAIIDHARAAADALQQLSRATVARPSMTPADVDVVLAHLAAAVAALPQAASQLSDILERGKARYVLAVDNLIEARDPDLVIDRARLHLNDVHEPAARVSRLLDAAHNDTAHISASEHIVKPPSWLVPDVTPVTQPPEEHGRGRNPVMVAAPVPRVESSIGCTRVEVGSLPLVGARWSSRNAQPLRNCSYDAVPSTACRHPAGTAIGLGRPI